MTVKVGDNVSRVKSARDNIIFKYVKKDYYDIGKINMVSPFGREISVYDKERTILDIVINPIAIHNFDVTFSLNIKRAIIVVATISKLPSSEAFEAEPIFIPIIRNIGAAISRTIIPTV